MTEQVSLKKGPPPPPCVRVDKGPLVLYIPRSVILSALHLSVCPRDQPFQLALLPFSAVLRDTGVQGHSPLGA